MTQAHSTKAAPGVEPTAAPRLARHLVVLIAAVARNAVIGRDGRMPWALPGDLAHFRRSTMGRPVIMGRRTYESIGHPLPGRPTIVLSTDAAFTRDGIFPAGSLQTAFLEADRQADARGADTILVAGGAAVYAATIAGADRLLLTEVDAKPEGDTSFPMIDPLQWVETERRTPAPVHGDTARYSFVRYDRAGRETDLIMAGIA